ncbi:hypothetical protein [Mesorhizobium jarvisii]|uniref:hypothetical protein n=1 Tax=Mesorhizobium jarvisii TaxID=1777867 RepID=UPI0012BCE82A|nr:MULTISPECIES: hypothetical protein [Mesorhizobium]
MPISLVTVILIHDAANCPACLRRLLHQRNTTAETEAMNQRPPEVDDAASRVDSVKPYTDMSVFIVFLFQKNSTMNVGDHPAAWQHSPAPNGGNTHADHANRGQKGVL